ncbi:MAG: hypothetical protein WB930_15545 [Syntrophobacteraceae bacterium]
MIRALLSMLIGLFFFNASGYILPSVFAGNNSDRISPKEEYELQEKCGKRCAEEFKKAFPNSEGNINIDHDMGTTSYENHYNKKLNKCFTLIHSSMPFKNKTTVFYELYDINEHKDYGQCYGILDKGKMTSDKDSPASSCYVLSDRSLRNRPPQ